MIGIRQHWVRRVLGQVNYFDHAFVFKSLNICCLVEYFSILFSYRGVGCIFVEMVTGQALFPGIKDTVDQLVKIWKVKRGTEYTGGLTFFYNSLRVYKSPNSNFYKIGKI